MGNAYCLSCIGCCCLLYTSEKNILSKDTKEKSAAFANAVWAMREAVFYYRDNQSAEVNRKGIQKLLKGMNLKDFTTCLLYTSLVRI